MAAPATFSATWGSLLAAVSTTANTATNVLVAVNDGVSIVNSTVSQAAHKQRIDHKIEMKNYQRSAIILAGKAQAEETLLVAAFRNKSTAHALAFDEAHASISALFHEQS